MNTIINKLRNLPDDARHEEFLINGIWHDIYFVFYREYKRESGGEPDEMITEMVKDEIFIREIHTFKEGAELSPDYNFAHKLQTLYNQL